MPSPPEVFWDWASAIRGRNGTTCRPPITIFIFAIIGEETGFVGCAIVLLFFAILAWCMIVIALQVTDRYVAMVLMCVAIWIVGQAMVNIGVVVGVVPGIGRAYAVRLRRWLIHDYVLDGGRTGCGTYALSTAEKTVSVRARK